MPFFVLLTTLFLEYGQGQEIKAAWVVRFNWQTSDQVDSVLSLAAKNKLTDIFIQLRGRGDAYYARATEPVAKNYNIEKDILKSFIVRAKYLNIRVHAWINVFLAGTERQYPYPPNHLLSRHPDWVLRDENGKSLLEYSYKTYAGVGLEGIYLNPLLPEVRNYHLKLISGILANYPFSGIHLDYFRLPSEKFYTGSVKDVAAVSDSITVFIRDLRRIINKNRINPVLSVAVKADIVKAEKVFAQNWGKWLDENYIDYAAIMNYSKSDYQFENILKSIPVRFRRRVIVGVSIYDKETEQVVRQLRIAEKSGYNKVSFFPLKYLSLVELK